MTSPEHIYIGTASWSLPRDYAAPFGEDGSHLERYAKLLNGVEINSSFYRDHKPATYKKWADSVPEHFRFSVKLSKLFTHTQRLEVTEENLQLVLAGIQQLGSKLGVLLIQLPPSLGLQTSVAGAFFEALRKHYEGPVAFEPRHVTWLSEQGLQLMEDFRISKVFADPEPCPLALERAPLAHMIYYRLHGSPEMYKSNYEIDRLHEVYRQMIQLQSRVTQAWCIFDNTTFGYATMNALEMTRLKNDVVETAGDSGYLSPPLRVL
jgi:uncharacterized protein YecE (DUF72 family)